MVILVVLVITALHAGYVKLKISAGTWNSVV